MRGTAPKDFFRCAVTVAVLAFCLLGLTRIATAQTGPGYALQFNGTNTYVSVPHNSAFNPYPLTASAWIRTTNQDAVVRAVLSKYFESSLNGWAMFMYAGRLHAWYFRNATNYIWDGSLGIDGGNIADGHWHHVAFVVNSGGGFLFVDGVRAGSRGWTVSSGGIASGPGAPTTTEPFQIARYWTYNTPFRGEIDEVTLWREDIGTNGINYVKHRKVTGTEDGLTALWHFDDGAGSTAAESVAGRTATLIGNPRWINSSAPIALTPVANRALKFDGIDDQVVIPHDPALNAFPLTFMGWVKTTQASGLYPGIAGKYQVNSVNGWGVALNQGRLECWYYRTTGSGLEPGYSSATDRFIADGQWHHVAWVVDAASGRVYIDGQLVRTEPWTGTPGATTSTTQLRFGVYTSSTAFLNGAIDHVSIWNVAISQADIIRYSQFPLTGTEPGLVAAYEMDETSGTTVTDLTGSFPGAGQGGFARTGSLARMGDGLEHILTSLDQADYGRLWDLKLSPTVNTFPIPATATIRRFHDFGTPPPPITIDATISATLSDDAAQPTALNAPAESTSSFLLPSENANAPATNSVRNLSATLQLNPVQLESATHTYSASVSLSHFEDGAGPVNDEIRDLPLVRLLDFNGTLYFGPTETRFSSVGNTPLPLGAPAADNIPTLLQVNNNSGYLVAKPTHHFGSGGNFVNVNLYDDGTAIVTSGTLLVTGPVPDREVLNGITFDRTSLSINPTDGARATVILRYPYGFSTLFGPATYRITSATASFANTLLDDQLIPQAATLRVLGPINCIEESKPFWIGANNLDWNLAAGQLVLVGPLSLYHVRQAPDDELRAQAANLVDPLSAQRISNDGYYHNIADANGDATIRADTNGAALLSIDCGLREEELRPHMPYTSTATAGHIPVIGGRLLITDDLVDEASSYLMLAGPVPVAYARDCADTSCSGLTTAGRAILPFTTDTGTLQFTRDGGLFANGTIPAQNLTWGYLGGSDYAQRTSDVEAGAFQMPGTFLRSDQTTMPAEMRPAVILFTGNGSSTDASYIERPGDVIYADGFANYGGLNFRAPAQGRSMLAGRDSGWYPLVTQAKYYARFSGISGIHQAASFPSAMQLYGYSFTFTRYALSYLDSENWKSLTDGAISFPPQPAGFVQEFKNLKFLCRGGLDSADVPAGLPPKHLAYWNTDFTPLTMQFRSETNSTACNDLNRKLVLGVEVKLPLIPEAFQAALGFQPDGNLVTAADRISGCDSRFPLPAEISLQGPGGSRYKLSTASDGYFNNWAFADRPSEGFYNIAGKLDVFFFEDVKVHLHVKPTGSNTAQVSIMGGWRALDKGGEDLGWKDGTDNFFNKAKFDPAHRGFPAGVAIGDYRDSGTAAYHPRAQKDWIEVAKFDYPLTWDKTLRRFTSFEDSKVILPVIDVSSRLKSLTPGNADIDFAQDLELKLPRIKALDFVNDAIGEISAPFNSLSNAVRDVLGSAIDSSGLARGFRGLQHALRDRMDDFMRPTLGAALDPVVDRMYPLLSEQLRTDPANFLKNVPGIVANAAVDLKGGIRQIQGAAGNANSVVGQLDRTLADVDDTINLLLRIVEKDLSTGKRRVVSTLLQKIASDQGPALGLVASIGDETANQLLTELEPTLAQLENDVRDMRSRFSTLRTAVSSAGGDFNRALASITSTVGALDQFQQLAVTGLSNLFAISITPAGDYFTANPAAAKQAIRERLIVSFLGSTLPAKYQETFKQFMYDDDAFLNTLMETLFQQVNQSIRNAVSSQLTSATDGKFLGMKGPGLFSDSMAAAKIRGAPTFNGDALKRIRLDADVRLTLGDEIKFTAYMEIKELDSQSTPIECIPAGAPAAEVTIGARDVPLEWLGLSPIPPSKLTLSVEARWTLQAGTVIGIGGMFDVKGKIGFKGCSINEIGATLAIGEIENFFGAKAAGTITILGIPVDVTAGVFVGHACSLDPLIFIDPEAPKVLDNAPSFTGIYVQFGGSVSLSEILFGTSSCVLDIEAGVTTATYYLAGPRSGKLGMRQKVSVDVELICLLSANVSLALFSSIAVTPAGLELTLGGEAEACVKIGPCPFCIEGCVDVKVTGKVNDGGIDYSVDL